MPQRRERSRRTCSPLESLRAAGLTGSTSTATCVEDIFGLLKDGGSTGAMSASGKPAATLGVIAPNNHASGLSGATLQQEQLVLWGMLPDAGVVAELDRKHRWLQHC